MRAGKTTKKKVKHDFAVRRVFTCGKCSKTIRVERQKGNAYYRCHTSGCTKGTIREEALLAAIRDQLGKLQLTEDQLQQLVERAKKWTTEAEDIETARAIPAQQAKLAQQEEQLLDALLDGLIDKPTFERRKTRLQLQATDLAERMKKQVNVDRLQQEIEKLGELLKSLVSAFDLANSGEKRQLLEIFFANRLLIDKNVVLEPSDWQQRASELVSVFVGDPYCATNRTTSQSQFPATEWTNDLLSCPEWQRLRQLHEEIHARSRDSGDAKIETARVYDRAA